MRLLCQGPVSKRLLQRRKDPTLSRHLRTRRPLALLAAAVALCSLPVAAPAAADAPSSHRLVLFDGTHTDGWSQAGPGGFALGDGAMTSYGGLGLTYYSAREFSDYRLTLDWRMSGDDNSGVHLGFPAGDDPAIRNQGFEVQIDATDAPEKTTGSVYGFQAPDIAARDAALHPPGEWNTFDLVVTGDRLRVYLNGVKINDFTDTVVERRLNPGHIGLQNHGDGDEVSFRDIVLTQLPRDDQ
ncbi:DUF1080 domain-containing protein [Streptomyces sp. A7024]|uniref:DUF1080 domain-containing protein n=1 Tax=Streptomyces coryli TaxID=1128680 RepID=A0A6G4TXA3_9ACTN|nr:DUF1080 domain-containing protein [Streptomyces coryli]